jgi:hypothetical protein
MAEKRVFRNHLVNPVLLAETILAPKNLMPHTVQNHCQDSAIIY